MRTSGNSDDFLSGSSPGGELPRLLLSYSFPAAGNESVLSNTLDLFFLPIRGQRDINCKIFMREDENPDHLKEPPFWGFVPIECFARENEVSEDQVKSLIKEIGTFIIKYKDNISSNQASFLRAYMRKKGMGKFEQEPLAKGEIAYRLKCTVEKVVSDGAYKSYLEAFEKKAIEKKAIEKRRINNNALLRKLGYNPRPVEPCGSIVFFQGGAPGLKR